MTTITIPRETFDQMRDALEVLNHLDADINFLNTNELEEMMDKALSAARAVSEDKREAVTITSVKMVGGVAPEAELMRQATEQLEGMGFRVEHPKAVQPQAQGEADYYADARTWYEWSTQTNWHSPKWDDFSPLGLARVEKDYQYALAVEQAWRLSLKERPLRANDTKSRNIFSDGFHAGSNHPQASEPEKSLHELLRMGAEENEKLKSKLAGMAMLLRFKEAINAGEPAWRDVETAPKDGTAILGCWPSYIGGEAIITGCQYVGRSWVTVDYMHLEIAEPIYWKPLPAEPEATK